MVARLKPLTDQACLFLRRDGSLEAHASFARNNKKLQTELDAVYTVKNVGSYKQSPRNFEYMIENLHRYGIGKNEILHSAESMFHDHGPANEFNLANCWIYRQHEQEGFGATMSPGDMSACNMISNSMTDLIKAHQEEFVT